MICWNSKIKTFKILFLIIYCLKLITSHAQISYFSINFSIKIYLKLSYVCFEIFYLVIFLNNKFKSTSTFLNAMISGKKLMPILDWEFQKFTAIIARKYRVRSPRMIAFGALVIFSSTGALKGFCFLLVGLCENRR